MIGLSRAALLLLSIICICSIIRPAMQGYPLHEVYLQSSETVPESNVKRKAKTSVIHFHSKRWIRWESNEDTSVRHPRSEWRGGVRSRQGRLSSFA